MTAAQEEEILKPNFGLVVLFGSGEASPGGRKVHDWVMRRLTPPVQVSILETPAGFQPNSQLVAGKVGDFLVKHLRNYHPAIEIIPVRKRGTAFSPDNQELIQPLLHSNYIFLGPGSPTYAARQLEGSLTWSYVLARHALGSAIVLASAAAIAASALALPVYEVYKVGEDLHWHTGLDLFNPFGLNLVFMPHWNNAEGGEELDTSRCFMGRERFTALLDLLVSGVKIVGIDEYTALIIDINNEAVHVLGVGTVTIMDGGQETIYENGATFPISHLGAFRLPEPETYIPFAAWQSVLAGSSQATSSSSAQVPIDVQDIVTQREMARLQRDWHSADTLRDRLESMGWRVIDTPDGSQVVQLSMTQSNNEYPHAPGGSYQ